MCGSFAIRCMNKILCRPVWSICMWDLSPEILRRYSGEIWPVNRSHQCAPNWRFHSGTILTRNCQIYFIQLDSWSARRGLHDGGAEAYGLIFHPLRGFIFLCCFCCCSNLGCLVRVRWCESRVTDSRPHIAKFHCMNVTDSRLAVRHSEIGINSVEHYQIHNYARPQYKWPLSQRILTSLSLESWWSIRWRDWTPLHVRYLPIRYCMMMWALNTLDNWAMLNYDSLAHLECTKQMYIMNSLALIWSSSMCCMGAVQLNSFRSSCLYLFQGDALT